MDSNFDQQLIELKQRYIHGKYDLLKKIISLISMYCEFHNDKSSKEDFNNLKELSQSILRVIISPLIKDLQASKTSSPTSDEFSKAEILTKWWLSYLPLLNHGLKVKKEQWDTVLDQWFDVEDHEKLKDSIDVLDGFYHWKIILMRTCLLYANPSCILEKFSQPETLNSFSKEVLDYFLGISQRTLQIVKQNSEKDKIKTFIVKVLENLHKSLMMEDPNKISSTILRGKFDKKQLGISHSVIFGWDGGFYALLNKLSSEEIGMLMETEEIPIDYAEGWKNELHESKIVIGEGAFGKIRLALALSLNETAPTMRLGEVICLKKTKIPKKDNIKMEMILEHTWDDYSSGELDHYTFSPSVYDMSILPDSEMGFHKGYTMQEFVPVRDASKIFTKRGKFYQNFQHQKSYLLTVFKSISNLLEQGICMTDLKPGNTLYNAEYERGMLIDLAGVAKANNSDDLKVFNAKRITELTPPYSDPKIVELCKSEEEGVVVNLHEYSAYAFGIFIKEIVLNIEENEYLPHHKKLKVLSNELMIDETKEQRKRLTIAEGLKQLEEINDHESNANNLAQENLQEKSLKDFMQVLSKKTTENFSTFGLHPDLVRISQKFIDLFASQINPETTEGKVIRSENLKNMDNILDSFVNQKEVKDRVLVLMGSSGSGKSTILQKKYLEALKKWKFNKPVPIFLNLAVENNLRKRWIHICKLIDKTIKFSLFAGRKQHPINLFLDSFDEAPVKMNFVSKFMKELGNNSQNRVLICCRSEFVQKDQDFLKWFSSNGSLSKWYIYPLNYGDFNLEKYAVKYYDGSLEKGLVLKLQEKSLRELLTTGYMVHLTLKVLPELLKEKQKKITRRIIYQKYFQTMIETAWMKNSENKKTFIEDFNLKEVNPIDFIEQSGELLAKILHKPSKNENKSEVLKDFLIRHHYVNSISCMQNRGLESIIRLLNLNVELRGSIPNERILIRFEHDSMKNYFIISGVLKECSHGNGDLEILGAKLILEDISLVKFLVEVVKEKSDFEENLRMVILNSRNRLNDKEKDKRLITAAANAISILVASNISFSQFDLSKTRICGANLNDGMFSSANFTETDLTGVIFENCKLDGSLFYKSKMASVSLGVYPETKMMFSGKITCSQFSPNLEELVAGTEDGSIIINDVRKIDKVKVFINRDDRTQNIAKFSPDGKYVISNGNGNLIRLWDPINGVELKTFSGHLKKVNCLCFSPNSKFIMSGSADNTINMWEVETRSLLKTLKGHSSEVNSVCFSNNGGFIVSGSSDETIILWDQQTGGILNTLKGHYDRVNSVCFSMDDNLILSGSCNIKLWDRVNGLVIKTIECHSRVVTSVCFSPDSNFILSGYNDCKIKKWEKSSGKLLKTLEGHSKSVTSVCFSTDGNYILSGSEDKSIKIWESSNGKLLNTLLGHTERINSVSLSPDDRTILSGSDDNAIKLWKFGEGIIEKSFGLKGHNRKVTSVCFSPDGENILSGSEDTMIKLWQNGTGALIKSFQSHFQEVISVAFSRNAALILSGSKNRTIELWELKTERLIKIFEGYSMVNDVCFSPNGKTILSCYHDETIKLWECGNGKLAKTFLGHSQSVKSLSFSSDGRFFLSGSEDQSIKLWDVSAEESLKTFKGHTHTVNKVCFSSDMTIILSCSDDYTVRIWELATGFLLKTFEGHSDSVHSIGFSLDLNWIYSAAADKTIRKWNRTAIALLKSFEGQNSRVNSVCFSPNGTLILSGHSDNLLKLWDNKSGALIQTLEGHSKCVNSVTFSSDGKFILSGSFDGSIKLWETLTGVLIKTLTDHSSQVTSVCFSIDGKYILSCSWDRTIKLSNNQTGETITFKDNSDINSVCFSPDGKFILSGSEDNLIKLWEIDSRKKEPIKTFKGHTKPVNSVCFSPDGARFLSGSSDKTIKLWDHKTDAMLKTLLKTFEGHTGGVNTVCFSPNGLHLLSGSTDSTIKLWDLNSGKLLKTLEGHNKSVKSIYFSPEAHSILSGSEDGTIKKWDLPFHKFKEKNENKRTEIFSGVGSTIFSRDGKLVLIKFSENSYRLWEKSSGSLLVNFQKNSSYFFPLYLGLLFNQNFSENYDFICSKTLSANETQLFCQKMVIINAISLSEENVQVFLDKNAIVHQSLQKKKDHRVTLSKILLLEKNVGLWKKKKILDLPASPNKDEKYVVDPIDNSKEILKGFLEKNEFVQQSLSKGKKRIEKEKTIPHKKTSTCEFM